MIGFRSLYEGREKKGPNARIVIRAADSTEHELSFVLRLIA